MSGGGPGPWSIAVVAPLRFPIREPFAGGLEAHTHALVRELRRRGHDVTLYAATGTDPLLGAVELPVPAFVPSAAARADLAAPPQQWMAEHHAYLGLLLDLVADPRHDVVHNNSLHHLPVAMSPALPVPVVTTLHTPPLPWLESALTYAGPRSRVVAVSERTRAAWRHVVDADVVHNGVDTDRWGLGPGGDRVVWCGRMVPEKAPHEAIDAAMAAGCEIDLAGPVLDPAYFAAEVAPRLHAGARHVGHLSQPGLRDLVSHAAAALVTPTWDEPFGLVAVEAMSTGTPVVAYARGALPEVITPEVGVLVAPGDVRGLARGVRRAVRLPRARVREVACRRWSVRAMAAGYEAVYAAALAAELVA